MEVQHHHWHLLVKPDHRWRWRPWRRNISLWPQTNKYCHGQEILSQTWKYGHRRGNMVTDVETVSETKWMSSNLSSSTTSSAVSRARWSADMLEAWDHKYTFARNIPPLLSYLDDATAVDNKEGVVGEVCCGVQHPETPRHLGFKDFFSHNLVFI